MRRFNSRIFLSSGFLILFLLLFFKFKLPSSKPLVVATIGEQNIYYSDFLEFSSGIEFKNEFERRNILDQLVNQRLILTYAEKSGLISNELKNTFDKEKRYKYEECLVETQLEYITAQKAKVSMTEISDYYKKANLLALYYIGFPHNDTDIDLKMNTAWSLFERGHTFKEVFSTFHAEERPDKNYLGTYDINDIKINFPDFYKQVLNLDIGQHTKIFETDFGKIILYRDDLPPLRVNRKLIKSKLESENKEKLLKQIKDNIVKNTVVNPMVLDSLRNKNMKITDTVFHFSDMNYSMNHQDFSDYLTDFYGLSSLSGKTAGTIRRIITEIAYKAHLAQEAVNSKLDKKKTFEKKWNQKQRDLNIQLSQKVIQFIFNKYSESLLKVSESEAEKYYHGHLNEFRKTGFFNLQRIELRSVDQADSVLTYISKYNDFSGSVLKFSTEKNKIFTSGFMGYQSKEALEDSYEQLLTYTIGQVTKPIKYQGKWCIFKIIDFQPGAQSSFPQVKNLIIERLSTKKLDHLLDQIKKDYDIKVEVFYENLVRS